MTGTVARRISWRAPRGKSKGRAEPWRHSAEVSPSPLGEHTESTVKHSHPLTNRSQKAEDRTETGGMRLDQKKVKCGVTR